MLRDMHKSWRWLFIGRLVVLLVFTPEVRAAEATAPNLRAEPADTKRALLAPRVSSAPAPVDATATRWYGYQTLIADASTVVLLASAPRSSTTARLPMLASLPTSSNLDRARGW
jgi:hypothetical protein